LEHHVFLTFNWDSVRIKSVAKSVKAGSPKPVGGNAKKRTHKAGWGGGPLNTKCACQLRKITEVDKKAKRTTGEDDFANPLKEKVIRRQPDESKP